MSQCETLPLEGQVPQDQDVVSINEPSPLDQLLHEGAREMLMRAVEAEVAAYIEAQQQEVDEQGRRLVVRNGPARQRTLLSGVGPIQIRAPRVDDRRVDEQGRKFRFTSEILPPYLRRTKSVEELIPWLYLKGISTGDFTEALEALLGPDAPGLSATTVVRLKEVWRRDYEAWSKRDLSGQRFVYLWADGIYSNVRWDHERQCLLVVIGALEDGRKQLLAVWDGFRESELSWRELLEDLKRRGLELSEIDSYYSARVPKLKRRGKEWRGSCPIHEGKQDSFAVEPETGRWYCHSKCDRGGSIFDLQMELAGVSFPEAKRAVERDVGRIADSAGTSPRIATQYPYRDEEGRLLYEVVRREPKDFRMRRPDGPGGWTWDVNGVRRVPYKLPELADPKTKLIYVVEGEKDADTLAGIGITATCNAGGAGKWRDEDSKHFVSKEVVVVPDADDPGRRHALKVARSLIPVVDRLKVVEPPDLQEKQDVSDWLAAGYTRDELVAIVNEAPWLDSAAVQALEHRWFSQSDDAQVAPRSGERNVVTDLSELPSIWMLESKLEWLVEDLIASGSVTLISAESGTGKIWLAYWLAAAVA